MAFWWETPLGSKLFARVSRSVHNVKLNLRRMGFEHRQRMKPAHNHIQCRELVAEISSCGSSWIIDRELLSSTMSVNGNFQGQRYSV